MRLDKQVKEAVKMSKFSVHNDNNGSNSANASKQGPTKMASSNSVLAALTNKAIPANATPTNTNSSTASTTPYASRNSYKGVKGVYRNDPRLTIRANRAGTRGFRAPEILLRVTHQTCGKAILREEKTRLLMFLCSD